MEKVTLKQKLILVEENLDKGNVDGSIAMLDSILSQDENNDALMMRARIHYKNQEWGKALNDLNRIIEQDPQHKVATNYREMVLNILTYWNKDNYNP